MPTRKTRRSKLSNVEKVKRNGTVDMKEEIKMFVREIVESY